MGSSALVILGIWDPATLEAMACREGIALGEDLNIQRFVLSSDCKQVIGDIAKGNQGPYEAIIMKIISRSSPLSCTFTIESR